VIYHEREIQDNNTYDKVLENIVKIFTGVMPRSIGPCYLIHYFSTHKNIAIVLEGQNMSIKFEGVYEDVCLSNSPRTILYSHADTLLYNEHIEPVGSCPLFWLVSVL
jgi:hypothetical protein